MGGRRTIADPLPVWPDMADALALFIAVGTQWRHASHMSGIFRTGIDYAALPIAAAAIEVELTRHVFSDLRTLEGETLRYWARRRK